MMGSIKIKHYFFLAYFIFALSLSAAIIFFGVMPAFGASANSPNSSRVAALNFGPGSSPPPSVPTPSSPGNGASNISGSIRDGIKGAAKSTAAPNGSSNILGIDVALNDLSGPAALLYAIPKFLMWVVGVISVIFVIIGGIQYISSAGNPDSAKRAKQTLVMALTGLVVAMSSLAIYNLVVKAIAG